MYKQSSSRNHRGKGLRVKSAIKIFIVVAICFWLLYQVKHSQDHKRAFEQHNAEVLRSSVDGEIRSETFGNNRKVFPQSGGNSNHVGGVIEEGHQTKPYEADEDDGRGTVDDRVDVGDSDNTVDEVGHNREKHVEDSQGHPEESGLQDNEDHNNPEANSQAARERQYQEDNASSAVVRGNNQTPEIEDSEDVEQIPIVQQSQISNNELGDGRRNGTLEVDESGEHQSESESTLSNGTVAITEKHMDNVEKEVTVDTSKTNTSMVIDMPGSLPEDGEDHLVLNGTRIPDANETISSSIPQTVEQVETNPASSEGLSKNKTETQDNSTSSEDLSKNTTETQDNPTPHAHEEFAGTLSENATETLDSNRPMNASSAGEVENGTSGSSDGGKSNFIGNATVEQIGDSGAVAAVEDLQESSTEALVSSMHLDNGTAFLVDSTQDVTVPSDSALELNASSNPTEFRKGESLESEADASSRVETSEGGEPNRPPEVKGPDESPPLAADVSLQSDALPESSILASDSTTGAAEKDDQIHLPTMPGDAGNVNATTVDNAVA